MADRAIGIVRVSQRDDDEGHSPEVQARALIRQAGHEDVELAAADIWDENVDDNGRARPVSGGAALEARPKLLAAVEAVEQGKATVILAERFDRFFRNVDVQREVIRRVEAAGGRLVTAAGQISHATADQRLHAGLNGVIAEYQRESARERSWDAVEIAIEEGRVPWRPTTPGYDSVDGRLVPNQHADTVEQAFRLRLEGETVKDVREYLAANGIQRSYHGTTSLLGSRVVLGEIHFGKHTPNLAAHEPIVDRGLWNDVQKIKTPRGRKPKSTRLLARLGVLRCASCDARMVVATANRSGYYIYRCPPTNDCRRHVAISATVAERVVVEAVRQALDGIVGVRSVRDNVQKVRRRLATAQEELDSFIGMFTSAMDRPKARQRLQQLQEAVSAAQADVDALEAPGDDVLVLLGKEFDSLALADQRRAIRSVIKRAVVHPADRGTGPADRIELEFWGAEMLGRRTPPLPLDLAQPAR